MKSLVGRFAEFICAVHFEDFSSEVVTQTKKFRNNTAKMPGDTSARLMEAVMELEKLKVVLETLVKGEGVAEKIPVGSTVVDQHESLREVVDAG